MSRTGEGEEREGVGERHASKRYGGGAVVEDVMLFSLVTGITQITSTFQFLLFSFSFLSGS